MRKTLENMNEERKQLIFTCAETFILDHCSWLGQKKLFGHALKVWNSQKMIYSLESE
jgi:hypothetical protein